MPKLFQKKVKSVLKTIFYRISNFVMPHDSNEYGICSLCGRFSRFRIHQMLTAESTICKSCDWDENFIKFINETNTRNCSFCGGKFRIRAAASTTIRLLGQKPSNANLLVKNMDKKLITLTILETSSSGGIFTTAGSSTPGLVLSEFFDGIPLGDSVNGVQCQDLQHLTFQNESLDLLISLDVLEHVPDLNLALIEILRVLKIGGHAIITVPIDDRLRKSRVRAAKNELGTTHFLPPSYHTDPIREEGTLVYHDFGRDFAKLFEAKGAAITIDTYPTTVPEHPYQRVIALTKTAARMTLAPCA